jgi:putative ABC transport system permease protein
VFTGIIIFNAMLGLFGLSFFISERRNKEIGVRKVCGASIGSIAWKLSESFVKKLLLAVIITFPLGYLLGKGYVSTFTDQIDIGVGIFFTAGFLAFAIVMISTSWKVLYATFRNPVDALRYE